MVMTETIKGCLLTDEENHIMMKFSDKGNFGSFLQKHKNKSFSWCSFFYF